MYLVRRAAVGLLTTVALAAISVPAASAAQAPLPAGAATGASQDDIINQTSCPAAGACVAVGYYNDSSDNQQGLIETQSGGVWSASEVDVSLLSASAAPAPTLTDVSCPSAGNCVAVGSYSDTSGNTEPLIETETNGVWSAAEAPLAGLGTVVTAELQNISCPSAGNCTAVGDYSRGAAALIETESDGVWTASAGPLPSGAAYLSFQGLSCSSAANCVAVGSDQSVTSPGGAAILETERNGNWTATTADLTNLSTSTSYPPDFEAVSCPTDGNCTAVGYYPDTTNTYQPLLENEVGGVWQPATEDTIPADATGTQSDLWVNSVSCASAGDCTAVGSYDGTSSTEVKDLQLTETGGVWAQGTATPLPSDAGANPEASLDSVACVSAGSCVAVGTYENTSGDNAAMVEQLAGGGWTSSPGIDESTQYSNYRTTQNWATVSCASDGYCGSGSYSQDSTSAAQIAYLLNAPAAPASPAASVSGTQATVSWSPPVDDGGLPVGGYTVTAIDVTNAARGGQTATAASAATSATVTGLTQGDTYQFKVAAVSLLGVGLGVTSADVAVPAAAPAPHTPPPTPPVPKKPTRAQIYRSLSVLMAPHGSHGRLSALRRAHGYSFTYHALEAGRVSVRWYQLTGHGKHKHRHLAGSGAVKAHHAGKVTLKLHLTALGRRLVASSRHLRLTAVAGFAGGGLTVTRTHGFKLS